MIRCHFVTGITGRQDFRVNTQKMEKTTDDKEPKVTVEVTESGPLRVAGNFILKDLQRDNESVPGEVWLCRCGKSSDKPFCDGTHRK